MINFGIIGAGRLGTTHAKNIAQMDGVKLAAVYDIDPAKAQVFNEEYGAVICNSADELANMVDIVVVASPSDCHIEGVRAAVKADKPVFSEKPSAVLPNRPPNTRSCSKITKSPSVSVMCAAICPRPLSPKNCWTKILWALSNSATWICRSGLLSGCTATGSLITNVQAG